MRLFNAAARRFGRLGLAVPAAFLFSLGTNLLAFAAVFWLDERFNASPATVGWFAGVWNLAYLVGCLALRAVIGRLPPRACMAAASFGVAGCTVGLLLSPNVPIAFAWYGAAGFLISFFWPPLMGWLSQGREGKSLARTIGVFNMAWSVANIVSPFAAGFMVENGTQLPIVVSITISFAVALLAAASRAVVPEAASPPASPDGAASAAEWRSKGNWLRYPAWSGALAGYVFMGILQSVFPLYAKYELGLREGLIGGIFLTRALTMTIGFSLFARASFWHFRILPMLAAQLLFAGLAILMAWTRTPEGLVFILCGAGGLLALIYNQSLFHGVSGVRDRTGRMAAHEAALTMGVVLGASAGGMLYQYFSMPVLFQVYACFLALSAALQAAYGLLMRKAQV